MVGTVTLLRRLDVSESNPVADPSDHGPLFSVFPRTHYHDQPLHVIPTYREFQPLLRLALDTTLARWLAIPITTGHAKPVHVCRGRVLVAIIIGRICDPTQQ